MSVVTLRGNAHLAIPRYTGLLQFPISYNVESEHPTCVFAVTESGLAAFRAGQDFRYWGTPNAASNQTTNHEYTGPTVNEPWYVLIVNYNANPTAVYYRIG